VTAVQDELQDRVEALRATYRCESRLDALLTSKLLDRGSPATDRAGVGLRDPEGSLERFLADHVDGPVAVQDVSRLRGGGANEAYAFTLVRGSEPERLVLRVKTPGAICATDATREFQMLGAVQSLMPTPRPVLLTEDPAYFGAPAFVSTFVPGTSAPTFDVPKATGLGVTYGPRLREALAPAFVAYCAALHSAEWSSAGLGAFDVPTPGTTEAVDWRLAFWERSWEQDRIEEHPTMLLMRQWLQENRPPVDRVSLLHGDYRNGNFLFDEEAGEITAVIDWELCYLGDRHSDLAYTMLPGWGSYAEDGTFLVAGLMDEETFLGEYQRLSGLSVDRERLHYYSVYNYYWAVVSLLGTGPAHARAGSTQLDVMYNFISGLGGRFVGDANALLLEG
jgi:aminoglycoside phosphotransferase (APT) family kinase protein